MNRANGIRWAVLVGGACAGLLIGPRVEASLSRNAAGARNMGEAGAWTVDTAAQFESEPDGKAWTVETGIQVEVTDRWQLLLEPVLFERQQPDSGRSVSGLGDTEVTVSWLAVEENKWLPPVVLGAKVKLPLADKQAIGTGKADYSGLLILGKEFGELEVSLESEYATFGSPKGEKLTDQFLNTLWVEYGLTDFPALLGEVFGNGAPTAGESRTSAALVGLEMDVAFSETVAPYVSFEIDTESVGTVRGRVEWTW